VAVKTTAVETATAVETTAMETATAVETATGMRPATAVGTATAMHLRVGGSTTKNREDRDTCDCEFFHRRPFHNNLHQNFLARKKVNLPVHLGFVDS
jgi:hypothetical protein